jgi:hypothetical protein
MSEQLEYIPSHGHDVLEMLDSVFPEKSAKLEWTEKEVWFYAGQRSVVQWLLELKRREEENT